MIIVQQEYPFRNSSACTSDWIGQVEGRVIYAHDLGTVSSGAIGFNARPDSQDMVHKTVQKYKTRFKEAWEELSQR